MKISLVSLSALLVLAASCSRPVNLEYFEKDDRTRFMPQLLTLKSPDIDKQVQLETYQDCPGKTICQEDIQFRVRSVNRFVFLKGKRLTVSLDERTLDFQDREYEDEFDATATIPVGTDGSWAEALSVPINHRDFAKLANAQEVVIHLGPYAYAAPYESRKNWRILVDRQLLLGTMDVEEKPVYDEGVIREDLEVSRAREKALREKASAAEEQTWDLVKDSRNPEDLRFFLEQYPDSPFVVPARLRLQQLERSQSGQ